MKKKEALYLSIAASEGRLAISANDGAFIFLKRELNLKERQGCR